MKNYILIIMVAFIGCAPKEKVEKHVPITVKNLMGLYTGITPCADCEGIYTRIEFIDSVTYIKSSKYLGKSSRAFLDMGQWSILNDSIITLDAHGKTQKYLSMGSHLIMLNEEGKRIKGALANYYKLSKGAPEEKVDYASKTSEGLDFVASGNEPYWSIEIDFDKTLRFSTMDNDSLLAMPTIAENNKTPIVIKALQNEDSITVKLWPVGCINSMSGAYSDYAVEVNYKDGKAMQGCGTFINKAYELHGTWVLSSLNGEAVRTSDFAQGTPELSLNAFAKKVNGSSGCNRLAGAFSCDETSLKFGPLAATKMMCTGKGEQVFMKALQQVSGYTMHSNDKLILTHENDALAEFTFKNN